MTEFAKYSELSLLPPLPVKIIDRDGRHIDVSGTKWILNEPTRILSINWKLFQPIDPYIEYATKRYLIHLIKEKSPSRVWDSFQEIRLITDVSSLGNTEDIVAPEQASMSLGNARLTF
jgi:hypothetical protein